MAKSPGGLCRKPLIVNDLEPSPDSKTLGGIFTFENPVSKNPAVLFPRLDLVGGCISSMGVFKASENSGEVPS